MCGLQNEFIRAHDLHVQNTSPGLAIDQNPTTNAGYDQPWASHNSLHNDVCNCNIYIASAIDINVAFTFSTAHSDSRS